MSHGGFFTTTPIPTILATFLRSYFIVSPSVLNPQMWFNSTKYSDPILMQSKIILMFQLTSIYNFHMDNYHAWFLPSY